MIKILSKFKRYKLKAKLKKLLSLNNPLANKVERAIDSLINNHLDPDEKLWIEKIELIRDKLNNSSKIITLLDYGARESNKKLTEKQMQEGELYTTSVSNVCEYSKSRFWALLLFNLVRELKPKICIELGTCLGISTAYQAIAQTLNNQGSIITIEGAAVLATMAQNHLQQLGLTNTTVVCGRFQDKLENILKDNKPVDYVFIDGHHDERATNSYFETFIPFLSNQSVIIIDDISWSNGMRRAWNKIIEHDCVKISINLESIGICIIDSSISSNVNYNISLV